MLAWFCGTELMPFCASTSSYQQNMLAALELSIDFMLELCISVSIHPSEVSAQAMNL